MTDGAEVAFVDPVGWLEKLFVAAEKDVNDEVPVVSLLGLFVSLFGPPPKLKDDATLDIAVLLPIPVKEDCWAAPKGKLLPTADGDCCLVKLGARFSGLVAVGALPKAPVANSCKVGAFGTGGGGSIGMPKGFLDPV